MEGVEIYREVVSRLLVSSKYLYRSERLDFTSGLLATEEECSEIDVLPSTLAEMLQSGDIKGLK